MTPHQRYVLRQTRRAFLGRAATGIGGVALASLLNPRLFAADAARPDATRASSTRGTSRRRSKRVIYLYMAGGPSHLETFDYKPKLAEMNGKPMPESITKGQPIAQLQGAKLTCFAPQHPFQKCGQIGQEICDHLPAPRRKSPTTSASSARCTPRRSTTTRPTRS